jgi:hypothetical protein
MSSGTEERDRRRRLPFVLLLVGVLVGALVALGLDELLEAAPTRVTTAAPRPAATSGAPQVQVVVPEPQQGRAEAAAVRGTSVAGGEGVTAAPVLHVTGAVAGDVAPGVPATLVVTVENPSRTDARVTGVSADVVGVQRSGPGACSSSWYGIASYTGDLVVPSGASRDVRLRVTLADLPDVNQDGCKGARYTFRFAVAAVPA